MKKFFEYLYFDPVDLQQMAMAHDCIIDNCETMQKIVDAAKLLYCEDFISSAEYRKLIKKIDKDVWKLTHKMEMGK